LNIDDFIKAFFFSWKFKVFSHIFYYKLRYIFSSFIFLFSKRCRHFFLAMVNTTADF